MNDKIAINKNELEELINNSVETAIHEILNKHSQEIIELAKSKVFSDLRKKDNLTDVGHELQNTSQTDDQANEALEQATDEDDRLITLSKEPSKIK